MIKKIMADVFGFGSFILIFQFVYIPLEDELPGWQAVLITAAALTPLALAWHYLYANVRQNEE